jgi:hypothetical protein
MRRYLQTTLGKRAHLGHPTYDDDSGLWEPPPDTICGLDATTWSKAFVSPSVWARKKPGAVCDVCDRTALWESISSLGTL